MDSPTLQPIPLWVPIVLLIALLGGWVLMNFWGEWRDSRDASKQDRRNADRLRQAEETWSSTDTAAGYESAGREPERPNQKP